MIRRIIIIVLVTASVGTLLIGVASSATPIATTVYSDKYEGAYLGLRAEGGILLMVWSRVASSNKLVPTHRVWGDPDIAFAAHESNPRRFVTYEITNTSGLPIEYRTDYGPPASTLQTDTHRVTHIGLHYIPLVGVLATYPIIAMVTFIRGPLRRYHRRKRGLCVRCGYNLTGNVSGVCPECGTRVEKL